MAKGLKGTHLLPDPTGQDDVLPQRSTKEKYREATQKLFSRVSPKDSPASSTSPEDSSGAEADNVVLLEDLSGLQFY